jgi:hypothetical protein
VSGKEEEGGGFIEKRCAWGRRLYRHSLAFKAVGSSVNRKRELGTAWIVSG